MCGTSYLRRRRLPNRTGSVFRKRHPFIIHICSWFAHILVQALQIKHQKENSATHTQQLMIGGLGLKGRRRGNAIYYTELESRSVQPVICEIHISIYIRTRGVLHPGVLEKNPSYLLFFSSNGVLPRFVGILPSSHTYIHTNAEDTERTEQRGMSCAYYPLGGLFVTRSESDKRTKVRRHTRTLPTIVLCRPVGCPTFLFLNDEVDRNRKVFPR